MTTAKAADEPTHPRNGAVFKSVHEADVQGYMPLGTEGPTTLGPEDYSTDFIFS